ncbi:MAG: hybrid sensor histidine kinase/response regulator [Vulcanimicrobiota bacterium]
MSDGLHILVAEDSALQAAVLRRLLNENGYSVTVARDGQAAWDQLERMNEAPALVISDIEMPCMDGYALCAKIKSDARFRNVPVILLTNLGDPLHVVSGLQAGADNYITKPFDSKLLLARIASLLASPDLYQHTTSAEPLSFRLNGKDFTIRSNRGQILNLLLSTFEGAVSQNHQLRTSNEDLSAAHAEIAEKNDQLKKVMALQNQFLGMVTHDMRNPLGVIQGYSRILADGLAGPLSEKQAKFLLAIHRSAKSLIALVNDLLEISQIESGNLRLDKQSTDLVALVEQAVELNGFLAEDKNIQIHPNLQPVPPTMLDPNKIEQVINNLLSNAIKYSHCNTQVQLTLRPAETGWVELSVADRGQGIPKEEQANIFQHYQRTSVKSTAGEKSTGLGLAIVKRIVEGHGGTIELDSEPGRGSTFTVRLPLIAP